MPRPLPGVQADQLRQRAEILREYFVHAHGLLHLESCRLELAAGLRRLFVVGTTWMISGTRSRCRSQAGGQAPERGHFGRARGVQRIAGV